MSDTAVLLIAHGSPERIEDIPEFLRNISRGRPIADSVVREVQRRYSLTGSSPLTRIARRQTDAVAAELGMPTYLGMRNWHPFIADTLRRMNCDKVRRAVAVCLAPHNSRTSVGLYKEALLAERSAIDIDFVEHWHDHRLLIEAFAEKLRASWSRASAEHGSRLPVLFTAHSVPKRTVTEGDPYEAQTRETAARVAQQVPEVGDWSFAFQSQGMSGGEWLGPTVEDTIVQLRQAGHSGLLVQPVGFVCDHVEILYDIDILLRDFAAKRGLKLYRAESLNDSPTFVRAIADLVRARLAAAAPPGPQVAENRM